MEKEKESPDNWKTNFDQVMTTAKAARESEGDDKAPGKPRHVERSEKMHAVVMRAHGMIKKFEVMKQEETIQKEKAEKEKEKNAGMKDTEEKVNQDKAANLAKTAEEFSKAAAEAAKKVAALEADAKEAEANGAGNLLELLDQLDAAKAEEVEARKKAEAAVDE